MAGTDRGVGDLLEGVLAGLAGLELDGIEQAGLVGEHQVVESEHDLAPGRDRELGPARLGGPRVADRLHHVVATGDRPRGERRPGEGGAGGDRVGPRSGHDAAGEATDLSRVHGIRGGGVECGIGDEVGHYPIVGTRARDGQSQSRGHSPCGA